jgi:hypothetical protein
MLSSPVFSKRDATIITVLLVIGFAMTIESHHHIRIVAAPEWVDVAPLAANTVQFGPSGDPVNAATFEPAFAPSDTGRSE